MQFIFFSKNLRITLTFTIRAFTHNVVTIIRPGLFSRSPGPGGGLRGRDAKNQGLHQAIEMKLGMNHCGHKSIPDAKFQSGSSSSFGDMTSQNFPRKKGTSHHIPLIKSGKQV